MRDRKLAFAGTYYAALRRDRQGIMIPQFSYGSYSDVHESSRTR
jgi:hypothetical protein